MKCFLINGSLLYILSGNRSVHVEISKRLGRNLALTSVRSTATKARIPPMLFITFLFGQ